MKVCLWKWGLPIFVIIPSWKSNLEPPTDSHFPFLNKRERKEKLPPPKQQTSPMVCSPAAATKKCLFLKDHFFSFWEALEHSWWDGLCSQTAVVASGAGLSHCRVWDLVEQHVQPGACRIWGALSTVWSQPCLRIGLPALVRGHWEDLWMKVWGDSKKRQVLTSSSPLNHWM